MTIRKAEPKDAHRIAELLCTITHLHHEGRPDIYPDNAKYDGGQINKMIDDTSKTIFVAVNDDDYVMGYVICFKIDRKLNMTPPKQKTLYIDDLCVDKEFSNQGIGKKLLLCAKDYAKQTGCYNAELNVWAFNENAVRFYKNCGMKEQRIRMEFEL